MGQRNWEALLVLCESLSDSHDVLLHEVPLDGLDAS
jgi:hypothetical protein